MSNPWFGCDLVGPAELAGVAEWALRLELEVVWNAPVQVWDPNSTSGFRTVHVALHVLMPPNHPRRRDCAAGTPGLAESVERFKVAEVESYGQLAAMGAAWCADRPADRLHFAQTAALPGAPVLGRPSWVGE